MPQADPPRCLVLLGGASGSGKSWLAAKYGRPHLALDDFYRELSEDAVDPLPRTRYGEVDWDHPGTWNVDAAVDAVQELLDQGHAEVPEYSISTSSVVGRHTVTMQEGPLVAEGVFAASALPALRRAGVEVVAWYVDVPALVTALVRFVRDVREHRKPLRFLLRRGFALYRADPGIRRTHIAAGFQAIPKRELKRRLGTGLISPQSA